MQVEKERLPWWRRALDFALGGIRSGIGLLRRNGKAEPGIEATAQAAITEQEDEGTEVSTESAFGPEVIEVESIAEKHIEPPSSLELEVTEIESNAEISTDPENGLEPENIVSEVEAGAEKPAEVENSPEPVNENVEPAGEIRALNGHDFSRAMKEFDSSKPLGPEGGSSERPSEIESIFAISESAFEVDSEQHMCINADPRVELGGQVKEEEIELTNPSPQSEDAVTKPAREEVPAPKPEEVSAPQLAPEPELIAPIEEPPAPEPPPPAKEPPDSEPEPPAAEPPAPVEEPSAPEPAETALVPDSAPAPDAAPTPEAAPALPFNAPMAAEPPTFEPPTPEKTTAEKVAAALKARGIDAEQSPFSVFVGQVYDGPLDLLLDLIRKQDIDIYDIPIAKITAQFLAYVDHLRASDMDVAGDFIYTAALLIHIKSKMLLPRAPVGPEESTEDPRRELVDRLLEHERFKNAAQMLHEKQMLEANTWTNPGVREFREDAGAEPEIAADTTDLVRIFRDILERVRNRPILNVEEDSVTVGQMIQFLTRRLTMEDKPVALRRLLSHTHSERALIAMFLGLLELVRLQAILLRQDRQFSEIFVKKNTGFEAVVNEGLTSAHDDWR